MPQSVTALLVQAPFTQLNSPYPAVFYLKSFLDARGTPNAAIDLAIQAARAIFSRRGLARIFADAERELSSGRLAGSDAATRGNLARYLSNADRYAESIDGIVGFLSGRLPDFGHALSDPARLPHGYRVERYVDGLESAPDPRIVASLTLEDLADFIAYALDPGFSLVRYAESKAASQPSYGEVLRSLEGSYVIREFVRPLARERLAEFPAALVCASVPFPGCLAPALAILQEAKARGSETAMGGGYVSTELRFLRDGRFFDSVDYLCFDSGFGSLSSVIDSVEGRAGGALFRCMRRSGGVLRVEGFPPESEADYSDGPWLFLPAADEAARRADEDRELERVFPDYAGISLGDYLRIDDSGNPMHALWSNAAWLKCRLAYGCYWGRCRFCDGCLDYIGRYRPADPRALYAAMLSQARQAGASGLHLVDEAAPVPLLLAFARENAKAGRPLSFWGNTRFEKGFTPDRAIFLSWAGFLAASAGIEVAGDRGLGLSGKGLSMETLVGACDALSRAGILAHAYLMYGLPDQTEEDLVDSLEILRQMFRLGLLHSAFWHPFVLTRHSPFYRDRFSKGGALVPESDFALNDLDWRGSGRLSRFSEGIEAALASYMEGRELDRPAEAWFRFAVPKARIGRDYVKRLRAASRAEEASAPLSSRTASAWLGGRIIRTGSRKNGTLLCWSYLNGVEELTVPSGIAGRLKEALEAADPASGAETLPRASELEGEIMGLCPEGREIRAALRTRGLLRI